MASEEAIVALLKHRDLAQFEDLALPDLTEALRKPGGRGACWFEIRKIVVTSAGFSLSNPSTRVLRDGTPLAGRAASV